jgi:hypothetical protein
LARRVAWLVGDAEEGKVESVEGRGGCCCSCLARRCSVAWLDVDVDAKEPRKARTWSGAPFEGARRREPRKESRKDESGKQGKRRNGRSSTAKEGGSSGRGKDGTFIGAAVMMNVRNLPSTNGCDREGTVDG